MHRIIIRQVHTQTKAFPPSPHVPNLLHRSLNHHLTIPARHRSINVVIASANISYFSRQPASQRAQYQDSINLVTRQRIIVNQPALTARKYCYSPSHLARPRVR